MRTTDKKKFYRLFISWTKGQVMCWQYSDVQQQDVIENRDDNYDPNRSSYARPVTYTDPLPMPFRGCLSCNLPDI